MSEKPPRVSFGLPVRNAEETVRRCLESILAQDFEDIEVVVSDNASTDGTRAILEEYAARDARVRLFVNREDIGQIENVNRVFGLSRGEYFRWIGADDWLEPQYARLCVEALESDPGAIAITTYFRTYDDEGGSFWEEYTGERVDAEDPARRLAQMLRLLHAADTKYDPIYSMLRRNALEQTARIRMMDFADRMLAAELSLLGRFQNVPQCLAHRRRAYKRLSDTASLMRRYHPTRYQALPASPWRVFRVLLSIIRAAPLSRRQRFLCVQSATGYCSKEAYRRSRRSVARFRRERLKITRRSLSTIRPLKR